MVDNGSAEPPEQVCAEVPGTVLLCEAEPGPGRARNHGAAVAAGSILAFIDADCWADPRWLRTIVDRFSASPDLEVIGGRVTAVPRDPRRPSMVEAHEQVLGYRIRLYIERDGFAGTGNMAMRRSVFLRVGPFGGIDVAEDRDWGQRATAMGIPAVYVDEMRIRTPARVDREALRRKWDRHLAHEFGAVRGVGGHLRYLLKSVAVAASPVVEIGTIAASPCLDGSRARISAVVGTTWIRWYRARRMVCLLMRGPTTEPVWWNDEATATP